MFFHWNNKMAKESICQSHENQKVSPSKKEIPLRKNTANFKRYEKYIMCFLIILFSVFTIGISQEKVILADQVNDLVNPQPGKESPVDSIQLLSDTPPSNLQPYGELYQLFKYNSYYTNAHREKTVNEMKGKVVNWSLPVEEVDRDRDGYIVKTSENVGPWSWLFGKNVVKTEIRLLPRVSQDREYIENIKTGDMITFKGKIIGASAFRRIEINPAVLILK